MSERIDRRDFMKAAGTAAAGVLVAGSLPVSARTNARYAIVGTGHRATGMWGKDLAARYANEVEFVGLCDKNGKRAEAGFADCGSAELSMRKADVFPRSKQQICGFAARCAEQLCCFAGILNFPGCAAR